LKASTEGVLSKGALFREKKEKGPFQDKTREKIRPRGAGGGLGGTPKTVTSEDNSSRLSKGKRRQKKKGKNAMGTEKNLSFEIPGRRGRQGDVKSLISIWKDKKM